MKDQIWILIKVACPRKHFDGFNSSGGKIDSLVSSYKCTNWLEGDSVNRNGLYEFMCLVGHVGLRTSQL